MAHALLIEFDEEKLKNFYHNSGWEKAPEAVEAVLQPLGFKRSTGTLYIGDEQVNTVSCMIALHILVKDTNWFYNSVRKVQMLRIEETINMSKVLELF